MEIVLTTERMLLRRFTAADVDNLYELDSDPQVMRYLTGGRPTPYEKVRDRLPKLLAHDARPGGYGYLAAVERDTGRFVGWFHLRQHGDTAGEAEVGYRLRRAVWGRGYATEGCRELIAKAFTDLALHRVFAETMAVNQASRRVMEKSGMRYVRTYQVQLDEPIPGIEHGAVEYALTASEWAAAAATA